MLVDTFLQGKTTMILHFCRNDMYCLLMGCEKITLSNGWRKAAETQIRRILTAVLRGTPARVNY